MTLFDDFQNLFDEEPEEEPTPPHTLARTDDPDTSHMAASQLPVTRLEGVVLDTITGFKHKGCISDEVRRGGLCFGLSYSSVTARYKALEKRGLIRMDDRKRPGESGRVQRVMWATPYYTPEEEEVHKFVGHGGHGISHCRVCTKHPLDPIHKTGEAE